MFNLKTRIERLEKLSLGLSKELHLMRKEDDHLHYGGRQAYQNAIAEGVEKARVSLCASVRRIEDAKGPNGACDVPRSRLPLSGNPWSRIVASITL